MIPEFLELVTSAAASVAVHALAERYMVGLYANQLSSEGFRGVSVRPGRHSQQDRDILTALAGLRAFRGMPFDSMLHRMRPSLPLGATVVAITAQARQPVYEAIAALEETGHGVLLLTVGDEKPEVPEQLTSHHLGGKDAWHRLEKLELA
jgi:uncharacterized protein (DUF58 family)